MSRSTPLVAEDRKALIDALKAGSSRTAAARFVRLELVELDRLLEADQALERDVLAAEASLEVATIAGLAKAAQKGDWRAGQVLLDRRGPAPSPKRTKCGAAKKRSAGTCTNARGFRTSHPGSGNCYLHGGRTPNGEKHAARESAERALEMLGVPIEVDPQQALLRQVWEAYGNVAFLRARVRELEAIYGPDHLGDERRHVLLELYNEERDRLAKVAKLAIDAGIAERAIAIAEAQADAIVSVVTAVLDSLDLPRGKRDAAQAVAVRRLQELGETDLVLGSRN